MPTYSLGVDLFPIKIPLVNVARLFSSLGDAITYYFSLSLYVLSHCNLRCSELCKICMLLSPNWFWYYGQRHHIININFSSFIPACLADMILCQQIGIRKRLHCNKPYLLDQVAWRWGPTRHTSAMGSATRIACRSNDTLGNKKCSSIISARWRACCI
jgi:hypothetical protein